jgi:hypothetical protein
VAGWDVACVKPSVGRIVHYVSYGTPGGEHKKECRAAIVTEVEGRAVRPPTLEETDSWVVGLCVLNPTGQYFNRGAVQMENPSHDGGTWHWPEREAPESIDLPGLDPEPPLNLSPVQIKQVVEQVQARLLQQAKRSRRTNFGT